MQKVSILLFKSTKNIRFIRQSNRTNSFKWIDGSIFSYSSWAVGQPDNFDSIEDFVVDNYDITQYKYRGWTDVSADYRFVVACELKC